MSSFVHHFKSICKFKLESQSGNTQFGSKSAIFLSRVTLKFYRWLWKTTGHLFYTPSSFVHLFHAMGEFKLELQSGNTQVGSKSVIFCLVWPWNFMDDLEKQQDTLSIQHQTLGIISKPWVNSNWSYSLETRFKIGDFLSRVTLKFNGWPWKTIGHLYVASGFAHHFVAIG